MDLNPRASVWPQWQMIIFRFFFCYFLLYFLSFPIGDFIPFLKFIDTYYYAAMDWAVYGFNDLVGLFEQELVLPNGSGDTSYSWTQVLLFISIAVIATLIWTITDYKKTGYIKLEYILWNSLRYFLAFFSFVYGIIKVFGLQMRFPSLNEFATPLGDFLPMRLSWVFIGYSESYQFFSGLMEIAVACLLFFRRTVTLGLFIGIGVFLNVVMLNLCYDVPVKIFSTHLLLICLVLLIPDFKRIFSFFIFNRPTANITVHHFSSAKNYMRITRTVLKSAFLLMMCFTLFTTYIGAEEEKRAQKPFAYGIYDIGDFIKNGDTINVNAKDSMAWKDFIFDRGNMVGINTSDTMLRQSYRRGYFLYKRDSIKKTLECYKWKEGDSVFLFSMRYKFVDGGNMKLATTIKGDSIEIGLTKNNRKFQLAEKQFHWLSEYNR